jgi:glycerophosphoryl diester phosphodiesterase
MTKYVAHRGANQLAPQNTMKAFTKACEIGADGIETDVRFSKDRKLVILHDPDISQTSDGAGPVGSFTYEQLLQYDFGEGEKIPLLSQLLSEDLPINFLNIEIKQIPGNDLSIADAVLDELAQHPFHGKLVLSSFSIDILRRVRKLDSDVLCGILYSPAEGEYHKVKNYIKIAKNEGFNALHPYYIPVTAEYIKLCHENGLEVNVWGCSHDKRIKHLIQWGTDAVITDNSRVKELFK